MAPDKKKIAADCWKKGSEAAEKANWDYAIERYSMAVKLVPDNKLFRQALRGVERNKYKNNKTGKRMAQVSLMKIRTQIKNAQRKENWKLMDEKAEEGLALNPWDAQFNAQLGKACDMLGYKDVALFGYENAVASESSSREFNAELGRLLEERGEYDEAIKCWERICKLDPMDSEARTKVTQLQATSVIDRGGYEGADSIQQVKTGYDYDRPVKANMPEAVDGPGTSVELDLKHAIRKDETNYANHLKLAHFYVREKRLEEAEELFTQALDLSGGDANIREQLEDVQLTRMNQNAMLAAEATRRDPADEQARENAKSLAVELLKRRREILAARVDRYPTDMKFKFELATVLMRMRKWNDAISHLQQASNDVRLKTRALVALGKCFIRAKQPGVARRQFELAIPKIDQHDAPELLCEAHYLLAHVCEEAGDTEKAEQHFMEVIGVDYEYRDARKRLEQLQSGDRSGGDVENEAVG